MHGKTCLRLCWLALFFSVLIVGCGPDYKSRGKVKGRVKFFDKYLTAGTVAFQTKDGRIGRGNIDFEGNYEVGDAPVGDCTITVTVPSSPRGAGAVMAAKAGGKPPKDLPEMKAPGGIGTPEPNIDFKKIVEIPGKYGSSETSGLTFTVAKGEQKHDITLTP